MGSVSIVLPQKHGNDKNYDDEKKEESEHSSDNEVIAGIGRLKSFKKKINNKYSPKMEEWDTFQWFLGLKRFILAILYFIVCAEELFVLKYVKWWLPLPLILCLSYLSLVVFDANNAWNHKL